MHLIDTNICLEAYLGQENAESCEKYLTKVGKGDFSALVPMLHVDSIALKLENEGLSKDELSTFFSSLARFRGLKVLQTGLHFRIRSLEQEDLSFEDSVILQTYRDYDVDILVSYDDDFDSFEDIDRKTPSEVLET